MTIQFFTHPFRWLLGCLRRIVISWVTVVVVPLAILALMVDAYSGNSCTATLACEYRSAVLAVGSALGFPAEEDTATALSTPAWLYGATTLALFAATAGLVVKLLARPRPGPVNVAKVLDVRPEGTIERPDLQAIMLDRLARAGIQAPSTVPAVLGVPQTDQPPTKLTDVPGFVAKILAKLTARNTQRVGYNIEATVREAERIRQYGMTFSVKNRANGRQIATETLWAQTKEETARVVSFRVAAMIANLDTPPSTSRAPVWAPGPESLRAYEDASYYIGEGRLDEALISCSNGLEIDPASLPLRYLLGTLHERYGHFLSAIDTYTAALNILIYDGDAFSRPGKLAQGEKVVLSKPARRIGRRVISDEATQIMWRYSVALTFGHRWIGRWLDDLRRSDGEYPHAPLGYRRPTRCAVENAPAAKSALELLEANELRYRTELAKRLRGFFHVRYQRLLSGAFPILDMCVFGEERQEPLRDEPGETKQGLANLLPPKLSDETAHLLRRRPMRRPCSEATIRTWMVWLLEKGAEHQACVPASKRQRWGQLLEAWQKAPAGRTVPSFYTPAECDEETRSTATNPTEADLAQALSDLCDRLDPRRTGQPSPTERSDSHGSDESFSRQRLAVLVYHIGFDLLACPRANGDESRTEQGISDEDRDRIGFLVAQLDLRLFFLRCALFEMEMLRQRWPWRRHELWTRPFLSPQLVRTIERGTVYRCRERISELLHDLPDRSEGLTDHELDKALRKAAVGPGRLARRSERLRGWATGEGDWNLWYYQACVHAMTMEEPPDLEETATNQDAADASDAASNTNPTASNEPGIRSDTESDGGLVGAEEAASGSDGDHGASRVGSHLAVDAERFQIWLRTNDESARQAVRALNQAVGERPTRGQTAIEAGVTEWLFYHDPDLDRLRPHLRFQRWSDGLFKVEGGDYELQEAHAQLWGLSEGHYDRSQRLTRLASETFTIDLLSGPVRNAAVFLSVEAESLQKPSDLAISNVWGILQRDQTAWRQMVGLPRFVGNPRLRAAAWRRVRAVAENEEPLYARYPRSTEAFRRARLIPIDLVMIHVAAAIQASTSDLATAAQHRDNGSRRLDEVRGVLHRASARWWKLLELLNGADRLIDLTSDAPDADAPAGLPKPSRTSS